MWSFVKILLTIVLIVYTEHQIRFAAALVYTQFGSAMIILIMVFYCIFPAIGGENARNFWN